MQTFLLGDARNLVTYCLPVRVAPQHVDVLAVSVAIPFEQVRQFDSQLLELAATHLELWHARNMSRMLEVDLRSIAAIVELVRQVELAPTLSLACHTIVNELRDFLHCDRVGLALKSPAAAGCRLKTLSGLADFDHQSESAVAFQAAADETVIRETLGTWPSLSGGPQHATLALRKLSEQINEEAVIALPLMREGVELVAVLVLTGRRTTLHQPRILHSLRTAAPSLASALWNAKRIDGGFATRIARRIGRSSWIKRAAVIGSAVALGVVMFVPWPYHVSASCTLEPTVRRIVCAPYDGLLEVSLVEPGLLVQTDEPLARMDAREIRWELASVTAERHQARKELERNLAASEITKAQLAQLEFHRLESKIELLESRESNHELRSPLNGIVLKGSVERLSSAPVKTGQPLFEVGQLDPLRLEIDVPADDFSHVRTGQFVEVVLDGITDRTVEGRIEKIRPRSEIRDGRNVFVAEIVVPNEDFQLRPGIRGRARIETDSHPLAWNIFHKAWDAVWRSSPTTLLSQAEPANELIDESLQFAARVRERQHRDEGRTPIQIATETGPRESPKETRPQLARQPHETRIR